MDTRSPGFTNDQMKELPLHQFFLYSLEDVYWAENHLVESLPDMISAATAPSIKELVEDHLAQTKGQVVRLNKIFEMLEEKPREKKCKAMAGILKEANDIIDETEDESAVRDAAIIMAAQKVEHYEIATYGSLVAFAEIMGHGEVSLLLQATLAEEKKADEMLSDLAESSINQLALEETA